MDFSEKKFKGQRKTNQQKSKAVNKNTFSLTMIGENKSKRTEIYLDFINTQKVFYKAFPRQYYNEEKPVRTLSVGQYIIEIYICSRYLECNWTTDFFMFVKFLYRHIGCFLSFRALSEIFSTKHVFFYCLRLLFLLCRLSIYYRFILTRGKHVPHGIKYYF